MSAMFDLLLWLVLAGFAALFGFAALWERYRKLAGKVEDLERRLDEALDTPRVLRGWPKRREGRR